ncbi:MAG: SUMF1/EgtB/PvdO family nonheme iron enzyme [Bacteroidota bacterium]
MSDSTPNTRAIDLSYLKNQDVETILRDNYLFVIGINEYQNCTPLGNAVNDAQSFAKVLNEKYRFKKEHTFSLINEQATIHNIDDTFKELKSKIRTETDNLIIFFCGHGYYDEEWDTAYWVPVEARADRALGEYFSHEDLMKRINRIETHHTVVIADSCYSGAAFVSQKRSHDPNSQVFAKEPSRWMLASGRNEPVNDGAINQNSPFTKELLDILERESNAGIRMGTLVERLKTRVNHNYDQTPIGQPLKDVGDKGGEFIFFPRDNEEERWKEAKMKNTQEILELFISDFRGGKFEKEALKSIGVIKAAELFSKINIEPTEELCQEYLDNFPEGEDLLEVSKIKFALAENRVWREALETNSLEAFENYLSKYPDGSFKEEADERKREQAKGLKAWQEAEAFYNIQAFENFIKEYPNSEFFDKATLKLKELKAWKHAKASRKAGMLEAFIQDFPNSPHLGKAEELLVNTEENKKKKKIQLLVVGVSVLVLLISGGAWYNYNQNLEKTYIDKMGSAKGQVMAGNFTSVMEDIEAIPDKFQNKSKVVAFKNLTRIFREMEGFWKDALENLATENWQEAKKFFAAYRSDLILGTQELESVEPDLKQAFQPHFQKIPLVKIDSFIKVVNNGLTLERIAIRVKNLSDKGDSLYVAGMYVEALEFYESAQKTDSVKAADYLTKKISLASQGGNLQEMILVPGGEYSLRSAAGSNKTKINSFYISKYEVKNKEYVAFLNEHKGSPDVENWISIKKSDISFRNGTYRISSLYKDYPVVAVSFKGAQAYAKWSDSQLPTELEWEFAASSAGQENFKYSGSDKARDVAHFYSGNAIRAKKTGRRKANKLGIHDMSGNVWEWVDTGNGSHKVIKGGSFNRGENFVQIESRYDQPVRRIGGPKSNGGHHTNDLGFRIIRRKK